MGKNDHIRIRNQITVAKIKEIVGEGGNISGYLDKMTQLVNKKLKLWKLKNES